LGISIQTDKLKLRTHRHAPNARQLSFGRRLGALPLATYKAGEIVLAAGFTTGRLLILKSGNVSILKENIEIAKVVEPGVVSSAARS
jgi:signal-transduction protein with cAMP-binding, CBS, and nucleotidyltransferase domain